MGVQVVLDEVDPLVLGILLDLALQEIETGFSAVVPIEASAQTLMVVVEGREGIPSPSGPLVGRRNPLGMPRAEPFLPAVGVE